MKIIFSLIISVALVASGFGQTRNVLVGTNNTVVQPTNFWSADASNARSGLGLGSAATNPASAFQPSSLALSNINSGDGSSLTNLAASNIVGILTLSRGGTSATNAESARSSLGLSFSALTNTNAVNFRSAILPSYSGNTNKVLAVNSNGTDIEWVAQTSGGAITSGIIAITNGGTGATNAAQARTNLGLGSTNDVTFNVGTFNGPVTFNEDVYGSYFEAVSGGTNGVTLQTAGMFFFGTAAATTRTNLGLGATWLTNTNVTNFRTAIGLGTTNTVQFQRLEALAGTNASIWVQDGGIIEGDGDLVITAGIVRFGSTFEFASNSLAAKTRTNFGLPLAALTNTNNANFIQAVLPSYTGNQSKVLALNSSANGLEWVAGGSGLAVPIVIANGGTGATNAETARTNLGLGAAWLTNTVLTNFRTDIGLGTANAVTFGSANILGALSVTGAVSFGQPAQTRTNLGATTIGNALFTATNQTDALQVLNINGQTIGSIPTYSEILTNSLTTNIPAGRNLEYAVNSIGLTNGSSFVFTLPRYFFEAEHYDKIRLRAIGSTSQTNVTNISFVVRQFEYPLNSTNTNTIVVYSNTFTASNYSVDKTFYLSASTWVGGFWTDYYKEVLDGQDLETNVASFSGFYNNGNFTNIGTFYGFKTNVGPFEGIGNFFASNNTTLSNETLFRVGLAEATNRSAQFGFRVARTNSGGEGFAVFSVYGYNALMMIGPSDRSRSNSITNTNAAIEADIYSISTTNKVMTLITTNTGAIQMHRPIGFNTNTNAPSSTNTVAGWIEFYVGTNSVRVPYYQ
jgi:hypothetical protein